MADATFWDRADVAAAVQAIPESDRELFRGIIMKNRGDMYQEHTAIGSLMVEHELQRAREALQRVNGTGAPDAPGTGRDALQRDPVARDKHIRDTIEERHGKPGQRMLYADIVRYWSSTAASLGYGEKPGRDPIAGKDPKPGSVDRLIAASRTAAPDAPKPVDPKLIRPMTPISKVVDPAAVLPKTSPASKGAPVTVRDPMAMLRNANDRLATSSISVAVRAWDGFDRATKTAPNAELRRIAEERREFAAQRIHALGYHAPGDKP